MPDDPVHGQSDGQPTVLSQEEATSTPSQSWYDTLPPGLKAEKSLEAFKGKDIAALAESYVHAQRLVGGSIRVPGKDAKPEDIQKFRAELLRHLGHPETPDQYTYQLPGVEGVQYDDQTVKDFLSVAHKIGLTSEQVQAILNYDADRVARQGQERVGDPEKCLDALRQGDDMNPGWGSTTPRYVAVAKRAMEALFHPTSITRIIESGLGNDPHFIRALYRIGRELGAEGLITGEEEGSLSGATTSAAAELEKIMLDKKHPYWDAKHPEHEEAVNRVLDLRRFVYG